MRPDTPGQTLCRTVLRQLAGVGTNPTEGCGRFRGLEKSSKTVGRRRCDGGKRSGLRNTSGQPSVCTRQQGCGRAYGRDSRRAACGNTSWASAQSAFQNLGGEQSPWKESVRNTCNTAFLTTDSQTEQSLEVEGHRNELTGNGKGRDEGRNNKEAMVAEMRNGCQGGDFFEGCELRCEEARPTGSLGRGLRTRTWRGSGDDKTQRTLSGTGMQ
jgi:hypothetical protein